MSKTQLQSKWELHMERRIKEKNTRERQWGKIKREAYEKYGVEK